MPTIATGLKVSIANTPQAKDDVAGGLEDFSALLDVLLNDLGGAAKSLYSLSKYLTVEDGGTVTSASMISGVPQQTITTDLGSTATIVDGKISYSTSGLDYLGEGEQVTDRFSYIIRLSNGAFSIAVVTITLTGSNDAPEILIVGTDSASAALDETNAGLTAAGTLTVSDPDTSDTVDISVTGIAVGGTGGTGGLSDDDLKAMLSLSGNVDNAADGTAGSLGWTFDSGSQAFDYLAAGETLVLTYTLTATDDATSALSDTQTVTITITGTNDAPVLTVDAAGAVTEDENDPTLSASGALGIADPDATDTHAVSFVFNDDALWSHGSLSNAQKALLAAGFTADENGWTYDLANAAVQFLDSGETITLSFTITATDDSGAPNDSDSEVVTITIHGANDAPEVTGVTDSTDEDTTYFGAVSGTDIDDEPLTYALAPGETLPDGVTFNADGTFSVAPLASDQGLDDGESRVVSFQVVANDGTANSAPQWVTITITGINDAPEVAGDIADQNVDEDNLWTFTVPAGTFSDVDGDDLTLSATLGDGSDLPSWLSFNAATGQFSGTPPLNFNGTISLKVTASDGDLSVSDTFDLVVDPVNDAPEVADDIADQNVDEDNLWTFTVPAGTFSDVDGDDLTLSATLGDGSDLPSWLSFDAATGQFSGTPPLNFNGTINLKVTASDGDLSVSDTFDLVVNPVADAAIIGGTDTGSVTEDDPVATVGGALTVDDPDAGEESFVAQTGVQGTYGSFSIDALGNWTYTLDNLDADLDDLDDGESETESFTVQSADGTTHVVEVQVNGNTDDALAPTDILFSVAPSTAAFTTGLTVGATLGAFTAVDGDSSSWTFALSGANASLFTLSPTSGGSVSLVVAGVSTPGGPQPITQGNYSFTVTATDPGGNSYVETYTVSVGSSSGSSGDTTAAFTITAGTDIDFGLNGPDAISGGAGDDALVGGNQGDSLFGGLGNDQLIGGAQNDNFIFNTALNALTNVDRILDFNANSADRIQLEDAIFGAIGATLEANEFVANAGGNAVDGNDFILYDTATGKLYYDPDGNGAAGKVLFAQLTVTGGTVDSADFSII